MEEVLYSILLASIPEEEDVANTQPRPPNPSVGSTEDIDFDEWLNTDMFENEDVPSRSMLWEQPDNEPPGELDNEEAVPTTRSHTSTPLPYPTTQSVWVPDGNELDTNTALSNSHHRESNDDGPGSRLAGGDLCRKRPRSEERNEGYLSRTGNCSEMNDLPQEQHMGPFKRHCKSDEHSSSENTPPINDRASLLSDFVLGALTLSISLSKDDKKRRRQNCGGRAADSTREIESEDKKEFSKSKNFFSPGATYLLDFAGEESKKEFSNLLENQIPRAIRNLMEQGYRIAITNNPWITNDLLPSAHLLEILNPTKTDPEVQTGLAALRTRNVEESGTCTSYSSGHESDQTVLSETFESTSSQFATPPSLFKSTGSCSSSHICSTCNAPFSRLFELRKHAKYHDKPISCSDCSRRFGRRRDLIRHQKTTHRDTHEPERWFCPYKMCRYHSSPFGRRDNLLRHVRNMHLADEK
ncbi:uncharacterized protein LY89DRAFT_666964 [Mollisia scopiformis]|uniref:C2H2-type domain-containing protein n=1 Tax=Mollisia scopiformis TaxID=149040 RepID=A0A194XIT3_MOLSC|nr:uncharacterized protein LY89DRAFT_666964 [Mollisia scopiformis]KUJ20145.1 hypothetical protein LY89DRAFT_666964 [Mollisia scopiformis]